MKHRTWFLRQRSVRSWVGVAVVAIAAAQTAQAQAEKPQYGGSLDIATANYTVSPLSWDPADWAWKTHQDALYYDDLFAGDLSKSRRHGGKYRFITDSWIPPDAVRGELAETWQWKENPLRLEIRLRKGVMFPAKPGVMAARELTADDVVFSYNRLAGSPKRVPGFLDHIDKVEAIDRHTVVFAFKRYQSDWDYRFGWGTFSPIVPKEVVDAGAGNWRNANGSGAFQLVDYVQGNSLVFRKNPGYWDKERIGGDEYALPFVDKLTTHVIKDEATALAALRTGRLDLMESIRWAAVDELKRHAPALKWNRRLAAGNQALTLRVDTKPFDDLRVRRALNMAVNKAEIVAKYYGGDAELFAPLQSPLFVGYFEPLDAMPDAVKELFVYNPDKARALLAEAGYPKGFSFKVQLCSCNPDHVDLVSLLAGYLEKVGVRIEVEPLEYAALFSLMRSGTNAAGVLAGFGYGNPTLTLRTRFVKGQYWNTAAWDDKAFEAKLASVYPERDEARQQVLIRELTREILDRAPAIWLPTAYAYTAWWPWVKNYDVELYVGTARAAPIYARIWVDQSLKKKMGF